MLVQSFLKWTETAKASERARAAGALARAYSCSRMSEDERRAAKAAMAMLTEDPAPAVRIALAEGVAHAPHAPRSLILKLAGDQIEVAARVVAISPVLRDSDLVDLVAGGRAPVQILAACRHKLSLAVCAALAEVGSAAAVLEMLDNRTATLAAISLKRLVERFGAHPDIRARLLEREDLPFVARQALIEELGMALATFDLGRSSVGEERLKRVTDEACRTATLTLAETVPLPEMPALVEHLRVSGRLTPGFLMHAVCAGNIDFLASALVSLSGLGAGRVRGILVDGRETAMRALFRESGLDGALIDLFVAATLMWRRALRHSEPVDPQRIAAQLMAQFADAMADEPALMDILRLVETMQHAWQQQAHRSHAARLIAEAA
ncbi:DUF2336 domain-containing protein [Pseudohoeflea coraliihabitans]|uniref:DUF2336 domain-containing protein n=1 Tax=Pseudohoeflea coraliihabitans TaxID=2860393 RepID=A0ABS6WQH9_9HYPH|nr:DUF2336 domain-containing protein [Pseudohoeflea sp. DP4N28-3]MBW3098227.1 DUF2336 domain-containing protein [Pseudohoeflea sp. DP4N28-3]